VRNLRSAPESWPGMAGDRLGVQGKCADGRPGGGQLAAARRLPAQWRAETGQSIGTGDEDRGAGRAGPGAVGPIGVEGDEPGP
jgi:hypothetical protein